MGSFSIWHWLLVLLIIVLIFGTKKLKNIGHDLGYAIKNFKESMHGNTNPDDNSNLDSSKINKNTVVNEDDNMNNITHNSEK